MEQRPAHAPLTSATYKRCMAAKHNRVRHSPDGVDIVEECPTCRMAWLIKGGSGDVIRMMNGVYEQRLIAQQKLGLITQKKPL